MAAISTSKTNAMKTIFLLSASCLLVLSACSTYKPGAIEPDDRYFSLADARKEQRQLKKLKEEPAEEVQRSPELSNYKQYRDDSPADEQPAQNGNNTVINNNYDMDDYYDYMYASRIRRFHRSFPFNSYYDPFYTNLFWYNNDPFFFGTSIYTTYSFFNPYVPWGFNYWRPGWSFGWSSWSGFNMNYGWGFYNPWGWNNFGFFPNYSPFFYNPWACHPFGFGGWNNGFMHGYQMALFQQNFNYNQMYYNSFDQNSFVNPAVVKPSTGGFGAGANMMKAAPSLGQVLSKEIGTSQVSQVKTPVNAKPGNTAKSIQGQGFDKVNAEKKPAGRFDPSAQQGISAGEVKSSGGITPGAGLQNGKQGDVSGTTLQKGRDGLIKSGLPPAQSAAGQYNSVPSMGKAVNRQNLNYSRPVNADYQDVRSVSPNQGGVNQLNKPGGNNVPAMPGNNLPQQQIRQQPGISAGQQGGVNPDNTGRRTGQPYKPSYDYNRTLPGDYSKQPQIRQQTPENNSQPGIRTNPRTNDFPNQNYQQGQPSRPADRLRSEPRQINTPVNRMPNRDYNRIQQQPSPDQQRQPEQHRGTRHRFNSGDQMNQPRQQRAQPSSPSRSFDRAPANGNIGGGSRGSSGNGGHNNKIAPARR